MAVTSPPNAIAELYSVNHGWLFGWLRGKLGNASDAADVAHDTYLRLMVAGRLPQLDQSRAYLAQIARHLVVDLHRRRRLELAYLDALAQLGESQAPSPEERALVLQTLYRLDAALDRLPARVREAFLLSQFDGLTYSTIADRMGLSVGAIRKYMLQAAQACYAVMHD